MKKEINLTKVQESKLSKHKKHHSKKHIREMIRAMLRGRSFNASHGMAMDKVGK